MRQTAEWLVRQRDMRRFEESQAARSLLDFEPMDFVGRTAYLEHFHRALVEERGTFLLWGGPGSGKSMLALKFAWRAQGAFDAVVFQHCGQRSAQEIGVELAERLGLDVKELPPDKQIEQSRKWLSCHATLLVLDDIWTLDVRQLIPAPPLPVGALSVLCTSRRRYLPWVRPPRCMEVESFAKQEAESLFQIYLGEETTARHRDALLAFAERVERLPIAVAVAAEMLSRQFGPLGEAAQSLMLEKLRNEIHDIPQLLQRAIESQPDREQAFLRAMAVCHPDGFWFPLAAQIAELGTTESGEYRDRLVQASLLRVVDQERQRFRLHALLREQLRSSAPLEELRKKHAAALLTFFRDWENRWRESRECLVEVRDAIDLLWNQGLLDLMQQLVYQAFSTAYRVGELDAALRVLEQEERLWNDRDDPVAKDGLQRSYGNQALILQDWGRLDEAMELHKKKEAICIELGSKDSLQRG